MKIVLLTFVFVFSVQANSEVGLINSVKSKKLIFGSYLDKKIKRGSKLNPLEFNDFPKQVRKIYTDFKGDLPQGYLADFNEDGRKDLVFLSKYKNVFGKKEDTVVFAAISTSTSKYKIHKVYKFKSLSIGETKLSKSKDDQKTDLLNYMADPEPGKLINKPVVIENYLGQEIRFKYDGRKFSRINLDGVVYK